MILSDPQEAQASWAPSVPDAFPQQVSKTRAVASAAQQSETRDIEAERKKGYDAGFAEGLAAGNAKASGQVAQLQALLDAMAAPFQESEAVLLRELLSLTERIARAVIRRELDSGADIERVLADALSALGSVSMPVTLTLNPLDAALCRDQGMLPNERFVVQENPSLARGGLQLAAGHSFVDASVETRIESALAELRGEAGLPEDDILESDLPVGAGSADTGGQA
ncbi:FliH/SctL family protein [Congregibacter brevis]|uniref:Flagellar assembly protein FliH n=1 Tax=Congregibacter brevis TaxID=3081201 RepID=A0ABZ0ID74_9GAMM|nr:FliH/SctL family protein [Congregibacter sp. IMCC45268]